MGRYTYAKLFERDCRIGVSPIEQDPGGWLRLAAPLLGAPRSTKLISYFRERSRGEARDDDLINNSHTPAKLFERMCKISVSPIEQDPSVTRSARASSPFMGAKINYSCRTC